jgi:hypothetical protein
MRTRKQGEERNTQKQQTETLHRSVVEPGVVREEQINQIAALTKKERKKQRQ